MRIGMWIANPQSAIRNSEDSKLHTLKSLLSRDTAGQKICEVRSAQPDDPRSCVAVSGSESRPIVVALGGDRQPLVRTDGKRTAVRQHRVLERRSAVCAIGFVRVDQNRVLGR